MRAAPIDPGVVVEPLQAAADLPEVLQFMRLLWALVHGLQRSSKRMLGSLGVTGPQRLVLRVVGLFPGISAGALAVVLHVHPSTLTGVIARLVRQGLLLRDVRREDRRRSLLYLSSRGARINASRAGTVEAVVASALARMPETERVVIRQGLGALAMALGRSQPARRRATGPPDRRTHQERHPC